MSIKINIPEYLQPYTAGTGIVEVNGSTVGECLKKLVAQFSGVEKKLFDKNGELRSHVAVYVNGEVAYPERLAMPVNDGDELDILYIIEGG